jgi:hypothetical protein
MQEGLKSFKNFIIELVVYGALVTLYALGVLRFLVVPLANLYENNLTLYAWISLGLIVGQGVILEGVTSFLLNRLRLVRFE